MRRARMAWAILLVSASAAIGCGSDDEGGAGGGSSTATGSGGGTSSTGTGGAGTTGSGGATTGTGGAGGGTGASQACKDCFATVFVAGSACTTAVEACDADTACNVWKNCGEDCFNGDDAAACYAACDAAHPHDAALSQPLLDCLCGACANVCVAACAG